MQVIVLEDIAEFAALAFANPARFAGRTLELAGDEPTPVGAAAALTKATGVPVRYQQLTDAEAVLGYPALDAVRAGGSFAAFVGSGPVPLRGIRVLPVNIHADGAALTGLSALAASRG
jgi:uncharacterized protein YbjT (DUF2867 family)